MAGQYDWVIDTSSTGLVGRVPVWRERELRAIAEAQNWGTAVIAFYGVPRYDGLSADADPAEQLSADRMTGVVDVRNYAEVEVRVETAGGQSGTDVTLEVNVE